MNTNWQLVYQVTNIIFELEYLNTLIENVFYKPVPVTEKREIGKRCQRHMI